jgi:hypothetical protein
MRLTQSEIQALTAHLIPWNATPGPLPVISIKTVGAVGGTNSTAAIQQALDLAATMGQAIVDVPPSNAANDPYIFEPLVVKAGTVFRSSGGVLKLADNVATTTSRFPISNINAGVGWYADVTIDGLIIDGNRANNTGLGSSAACDMITIGGENVIVQNCTIYDCPDSGITFSQATNSSIVNNRISNGLDAGIYTNDSTGGTAIHENVIAFNRITGFATAIAHKRIAQRNVVMGNVIYDCGSGITTEEASSTTDYGKNLTIMGNRLRRIGYNDGGYTWSANPMLGIVLRGADHSVCIGNRIEDCQGINLILQASSYCKVDGNIISGESTGSTNVNNGNYGIYLQQRTSTGCHYNQITGNIITGTRLQSIYVNCSVSSFGNKIDGNTIVNCQKSAIHVVTGLSKGNSISRNTIKDAVENAIVLADTTFAFSHGAIEGNTILAPTLRGIYLGGTQTNTYNRIANNTVEESGSSALRVDATWDSNMIANNILDAAGGFFDLEYFAGASDNIVANNVYVNATITGSPDQSNQVSDFRVHTKRHSHGTAAPATGTWAVGEFVWNTAPTAGGTLGWVCTTGGSPGTWTSITAS